MNATQAVDLSFKEVVWQVFEDDPERFKALLKQIGFTLQTDKLNYTTREMCEVLGINYNTWMNSEVKNDPRIVALRDSSSSKNILYPVSSIETIYEIWKERKR